MRRLPAALLLALAVLLPAGSAFAQTTDPSTDPPTSTEPSTSTEPATSTDPTTSTDPGTDPSSTTEPGDTTTSTSEPPTTTTQPPIVDLEALIPRPEFGALSLHQRALVDDVQRATFTYALRRLDLLDTQRQLAAAKDVLARARAAEGAAIANEVVSLAESGADNSLAEVRTLRRQLDGVVRRAHATRVRAQDALTELKAKADSGQHDLDAALADRADAQSGLQDELGPDAVKARPDDVTDLLLRVQADQPDGSADFQVAWPVPGAAMASPFGLRNDPLSNGAGFHPGVDVQASYGTEIHAAAAGRIVKAGDCGGYGNCIVIDHGSSVATLYGHLSQIDVSVGDTVDAGDVIGLAGSTGWSTGAHLHFEVRVHGLPTDPILLLGVPGATG